MVMNPNILNKREQEQRILEHAHIVEKVAQRIKGRIPNHIEYQELCSIGYIGLLEALERYDDDKNVPFRVYAEIRINGAMIDFLRKEDWMPRNLRQQVKEIQRAEYNLECRGQDKTDRNIAQMLDLSETEVCKVRGEASRRTISGSITIGDSQVLFVEECIADESQDIVQQLIADEGEHIVQQAMESLPEKEQFVLTQYFVESQNLREIGELLGVTESRACQLRKSGIRRLQKMLLSGAA
jgi:RNA polymerase sigma factor for flagellar operon FliA